MVFEGRTECLPCAGGLWDEKEKSLRLLVRQYFHKRMSALRTKVAEPEHLEWHLYKLREAFPDLWPQAGTAEPPAEQQLQLPPPLPPPLSTPWQPPAELLLPLPPPLPPPVQLPPVMAHDRLECPLHQANHIIPLYLAGNPAQLECIPESPGHEALGDLLKALLQRPDSAA